MDIKKCDLCPRRCGVNREKGEVGFCGAGGKVEISWYGKHFGEEPAISGPSRLPSGRGGGLARRSPPNRRGEGGSGTIFFCRCNLKCVYCQNWQISQECSGCNEYSVDEVVKIMLRLQEMDSLNINLVTPTIWSFWLKEAILKAKRQGLEIPIVWNSNAYEQVRVLREFEGIIDIYLPDYKYSDDELAVKYSNAPGYSKIAREAILEMQKQVGDLIIDENGIAKKGLIVRHLILPGQVENTRECLRFIRSISDNIHLSLMRQYYPTYRAKDYQEINRALTKEEYNKVLLTVEELKFKNGWIQEFEGSSKCLNPDFTKENPFSAG